MNRRPGSLVGPLHSCAEKEKAWTHSGARRTDWEKEEILPVKGESRTTLQRGIDLEKVWRAQWASHKNWGKWNEWAATRIEDRCLNPSGEIRDPLLAALTKNTSKLRPAEMKNTAVELEHCRAADRKQWEMHMTKQER
jgi:hypothetical protein